MTSEPVRPQASEAIRRNAHRILFAAALLAALSAGCGDDVVTESYATRAEAEQAGAVARGWVPAGIPQSAESLREAHDLDTNRRWGLFDFHPSEGATLQDMLRPGEISIQGQRCGIPARIEWWPVLLRGALDDEALKGAGLKAYRSKDGELIVVANWAQGRAYYWGE